MWEQCANLVRTKITADDPAGFLIAECPITDPNASEHAKLIACAPELLEMLQDFACQYKCGCEHPVCKNCGRDREAAVVIAKATGAKP